MERKSVKHVIWGLMLIGLGVALLARQMHLSWAPDLARLWPLVFYAMGAAHLSSPRASVMAQGIWFLFLGTIFLLHTYEVLRLRDSWPLFIVAAGAALLMGQLACQLGFGRRSRTDQPGEPR